MITFRLVLKDDDLTQYFEDPVKFKVNLKQYFPNILYLELKDWIDESVNLISLATTVNEECVIQTINQYCSYTKDRKLSQALKEVIQWESDDKILSTFNKVTTEKNYIMSNFNTFEWLAFIYDLENYLHIGEVA